ncbi:endonuclease/exonuclease/phosphatase family protein [Candidatus Parcubacteria bacterium]|nr:endonuclease/exonuclease/phosphatase family protein [Candidatus Parcubacteria bacterium]
MKIVSLNTWAGVVIDPLLDFFQKYREIDIFCLQEIYSKAEGKAEPHPELDMKLDLFERIEELLRDTHFGYFRPAHRDYYGQAIFIRKNLLVEEEGDIFIYENKDPEKRGGHSRNLQYIRIVRDDVPVVVANLHGLWNGMGKSDTEDRLEQGRRIRDFIGRCSDQVIVVGDFNLNPDTQSLAIAEEGMRNLVKEYGISSTRTSFYKKEGKFADYALVSPNIKVTDFRVLPEEVSDHAALYLEIEG